MEEALSGEKSHDEEVVGGGAVGHVAMTAILRNRSVLEHEGPALGLMALGALLGLEVQAVSAGFVRAVAVRAAEHALTDGVVRGQVQLSADVRMAFNAEAGRDAGVRQQVA